MKDEFPNLAVMHRAIAQRWGDRPALRFKQHGLYHDLSWTEYRRQADRAAAGLIALGIGVGDRVGILSENRYEWLIADIAILSTGAVDVPMHAPLTAPQIEYQLSHSGCRGVIVSNQLQADKVREVLPRLPGLEFIVAVDRIEWTGTIPHLSWETLKHRGSGNLRDRERQLTRDSLATIVYTSGTTGNPKGVMLTHGNLLSNSEAMLEVSAQLPTDILLSWLPYSHIYARTVDHYATILAGGILALAESRDTLLVNLREIEPMWVTAVPRFYEKVWCMVERLSAEERSKRLQGLFGPRLRWLSSGGAPLPLHVAEGFEQAGLKIREGYGLTESSPVITFNRLHHFKLGTVGTAIPGVEVKIAPEDGEILTRGPHVMKGYWNDPEATAAVIVDDWLLTGDVGHLDDQGFLTITDRKKDLLVTSGGKNIAPSEIERILTSDPAIDQAVIFGDAKPFITALIVPNFAALPDRKPPETPTWDDPEIVLFFQERVDRLMQTVSQPERVKRFVVLSHPLLIEAGELTPTLKVRRRQVIAKYREALEELYSGSDEVCG